MKRALFVVLLVASCGGDPAPMNGQPGAGGTPQVDASGAGGASAGTGGTGAVVGATDAGSDVTAMTGGAGGRASDAGAGGASGAGGTIIGTGGAITGAGGAGGGMVGSDAGAGGTSGVPDAGAPDTGAAPFCPQYPNLTSSSCAVLGANSIPIYRWRGDTVCGVCTTGTRPADQKTGCKVTKPTDDLPSEIMLCVQFCNECCYKEPNMPCSTNADCCSPLTCQDNGPGLNKTCK